MKAAARVRARPRSTASVALFRASDNGSVSKFIFRLAEWLQCCGVKVELYDSLRYPTVGRYDDETLEISIDCRDVTDALMTLAHEAGHWLGYRMFGRKHERYQRERQAFVYGWRVLMLIGAAGAVVTRQQWIGFHTEP